MRRFAKTMNHQKICAAALVLATVLFITIIYGPTLHYPFFFDDFNSLMNNQGNVSPQLTNPAPSLESLIKQPLRPNRELTWLTFAANYKLTGMNPAGFRIVNFTLHGLCTFLVYLLLALLWQKNNRQKATTDYTICVPALIGALLFLCHPLTLNTVIYISQRFGELASLFYLAGFYAWIKGHSEPETPPRKNWHWGWLFVAGVSFWAALHCKEMAITLPATILFYEIYTKNLTTGTRRKWLIPTSLLALVAALFLVFAWQIGLFNQTWINIGFRSKRLWSPGIHFLSEAKVFFLYWKFLLIPLPDSLSLHHEMQPCSSYFDPASYAAVSGHIALLILALKLRQKAPLIGFGIAWFYLVLAPPYLFLPQRELLVEYKTYLATPGISMIILGLFSLGENFSNLQKRYRFRNCAYAITGCWLIFLSLVTCQRRTSFQNPITIWSDVLVKYPESRRALNNRAVAWLKEGSPQKTLNDFDRLLRKHPDYARGFENRGRLRLYLKDFSGAIRDFNHTLFLLPNEPELQTVRREIENLKKSALTEKSKVKLFNTPQKPGASQPGPQK